MLQRLVGQLRRVVGRFAGHSPTSSPSLSRRDRRKLNRPSRLHQRSSMTLSWVIPGKLAVGSSPLPGDIEVLKKAHIRVIFSLCATTEETLPEEISHSFRCLRLVLPDSRYRSEMKPTQLAAAVDIVQHSIQNHLPVYVHCLAGVERSPTVCIAYLCKYYNLQLWEALNWLKQVHPPSMPSEGQLRAVQQFLAMPEPLAPEHRPV